MEKEFDVTHDERYTGNGVIECGYRIYDEWKEKKYSSQKIVGIVEGAVASARAKGAKLKYVEALSCLFALDMRIKEKYNNLVTCLLSYFSWRRETRALKLLKGALHIPEDAEDIRTAIEVELKKLRERIESEEDDGDDETHGGKRNGKADEDAATAEEKGQEEAAENDPDEISDIEEAKEGEETVEETADEVSEQSQTEEQTENVDDKQNSAENAENSAEETAKEDTQENIEENTEFKEENNGPEEKSEPSTDRTKEDQAYNGAIDTPPAYEEGKSESKNSSEGEWTLEDDLWYDMQRRKAEEAGQKQSEEVKQDDKSRDQSRETNANQKEDSKGEEKDALLYDRTAVGNGKDGDAPKTEGTPDAKVEQPKGKAQEQPKEQTQGQAQEQPEEKVDEAIQNEQNIEEIKRKFENLRVPLHVELDLNVDNETRNLINENITENSIMDQIKWQTDVAREQLAIAYAELGFDEPVEIVGMPEPEQISQPSISHNRK